MVLTQVRQNDFQIPLGVLIKTIDFIIVLYYLSMINVKHKWQSNLELRYLIVHGFFVNV